MFQPAKSPSLPALWAVVIGQLTPGLYPAFRRRKLHISHFRPKGRKLAHSTAPPLPTEPACAGLRRGPRFVLRRVLESGPISLPIPRVGQGPSPALQSATQPLTVGHTGLLGPAAPGASAVAAVLFPVPAPPTSAGSADQSLPVEAVLCTTNSRFGSRLSWL